MEPFDEYLAWKIRQEFEEINDGKEEQGWLMLEEKRAKKSSSLFVFIGIAASATLIFFFATLKLASVYLLHEPTPKIEVADHLRLKMPLKTNLNGVVKVAPAANRVVLATSMVKSSFSSPTDLTNKVKKQPAFSSVKINRFQSQSYYVHSVHARTFYKTGYASGTGDLAGDPESLNQPSSPLTMLSSVPASVSIYRVDSLSIRKIALIKTEQNFSEVTMIDPPTPKKLKPNNNSSFAIGAFSGVASNGNSTLGGSNLSGGISGEVSLGRHFSLTTALALASFKGKSETSVKVTVPASLSPADAPARLSNAFRPIAVVERTTETLTASNVNLLQVDVPLNFAYNFRLKRASLFASGGVISSVPLSYSYAPDQIKKIEFARQLMVSVGGRYPLGHKLKLIVEPFYKYPLKKDIGFFSSPYQGLILKVNFQTSPKPK